MIKINSLYDREIISIFDGSKIGEINDIEMDEKSGVITSLVISGRLRLFGLLGRKEPILIPWKSVRVIGEETILVDTKIDLNSNKKNDNLLRSYLE